MQRLISLSFHGMQNLCFIREISLGVTISIITISRGNLNFGFNNLNV